MKITVLGIWRNSRYAGKEEGQGMESETTSTVL